MTLDVTTLLPLLYLIGAISADTAGGIAVAVKVRVLSGKGAPGAFQWTKLPQYVETTVAPFISPVAVLTVVSGFANGEHSFSTAALTASMLAIAVSYTPRFLSDARAKWLAFAAGITVPPKAA